LEKTIARYELGKVQLPSSIVIFTIKAKSGVSGVTLSVSDFALEQDIKLLTNTILS
jgi:hypothetical protein